MVEGLLIVLNIPVYIFIAWLVFDSADYAGRSFLDTVVMLLKIMFLPVIWFDDDQATNVFHVAAFFGGCVGVVWLEHWLLYRYVFIT